MFHLAPLDAFGLVASVEEGVRWAVWSALAAGNTSNLGHHRPARSSALQVLQLVDCVLTALVRVQPLAATLSAGEIGATCWPSVSSAAPDASGLLTTQQAPHTRSDPALTTHLTTLQHAR